MENKRLTYLDLCKVLAMFLVVWGHAIQHFIYGMNGFAHDDVWRGIQSFHMPLFMVIAGYFSSSSMSMPFGKLVFKKARQLLLPCASWGILSYVALYFTIGNHLSLVDTFIENFWFLKSVFICYLLAWAACRMNRFLRLGGGGNFIILIVSLFIGKYDITRMLPCFLFGMLLRQKAAVWLEHKRISYASAFVFLLLLALWTADENIWITHGSIQDCLSGAFGWGEYIYKYLVRLVIGVTGSICVMSLMNRGSRLACLRMPLEKMSKMGQYTLGVYILQTFLLERIMARVVHLGQHNYLISILILTPFLAFLVFVLCTACVYVLSKNTWAGCLLFGKINNKNNGK